MSEYPGRWQSYSPLSSGFKWEISELLLVGALQVPKAAAALRTPVTGSCAEIACHWVYSLGME